ncbi:MAG: hypothetical protein PHS61_02345 [Candidatus Omnitrophica bacterium]|nr:hypothetical protein [Candidatus Omnitrophota bacterium]
MNLEESIDKMKKDPDGADALEADDRLTKVLEELTKDIGAFVIWLTGLSIGEVVFILSNLDKIFVEKSLLFRISASLLIICIFAGLVYHLLKIIILLKKRELYFGVRQLSLAKWHRNAKDIPSGFVLGKNVKMPEGNYKKTPYFVVLGIEWSWRVNVVAFFAGSLSLVVLISIKLFT